MPCPKAIISRLFRPHDRALLYAQTRTFFHISPASKNLQPVGPDTKAQDNGIVEHARRGQNWSRDRIAQREFFFDVLNVNATRRDAKQYLSHFKHDSRTAVSPRVSTEDPKKSGFRNVYAPGINLGSLYAPSTAIGASPVFHQRASEGTTASTDFQRPSVHAALVSIRLPETISDHDLDGIALTLSQLVRLGMQIVVMLDCGPQQTGIQQHKRQIKRQAGRLDRAMRRHNPAGARYIDSSLQSSNHPSDSAAATNSLITVSMPLLLFEPLKRDCIPIVPCLAYTESCQAIAVDSSAVMAAITRCMAGLVQNPAKECLPLAPKLDRIIMIDGLGGIPSTDREGGSHVFVNMEQEYDDIVFELSNTTGSDRGANEHHLENLKTLKDCLAMLPPTSSALVISPEEAASSSRPVGADSDPASIRTRRQKNPLIHNLLTNRPVISPSLPVARVAATSGQHEPSISPHPRSTLVKRGMPVAMIPNPRHEPWVPPQTGISPIALDGHDQIHFARLLDLVEDSFRRPLDVKGYLERVHGSIAGVIIAGQYEGGAILTWESPPQSNGDPNRLVPYLDKFAVLQKAQGNAGVADIVFQAMVRTCFPRGVCWRSRSANPVNKWYFERSVGTWKLPGGYWTMFWTTSNEELILDEQKWKDYVAVCQGVKPTWADGKNAD